MLDYDYIPGQPPKINHALIEQLKGQEIALVTNQDWLPFGIKGAIRKDGRPYPKPADFVDRLKYLLEALDQVGVKVASIRICIYHPKADPKDNRSAFYEVLRLVDPVFSGDIDLSSDETWRKPSPYMLINVGATIYYGDSPEDEGAANAAWCEFVCVDRFTGV